MEAAKAAIGKITGRTGHQTDVDEVVNPAVTSETVKPHRHEETTEAVDREVHQDHYHTTVQPVQHQEVLPEKHTHNLIPQVEREVQHGDQERDVSRVASELGQFKDTSMTQDTTHSTQAAPQVVGEHTHHHVHETVQPVIHKETIKPEVVHTTIPIHEKHIAPSEHHGLSQLPMKTMDEVKQMGLNLGSGGQHSREEYDGHPRPYSADLQKERAPADVEPRKHDGTHDPDKTGHREWLSGAGGKPLAGQSSTGERGLTGTTGSAPLHGSSDERHGAEALAGGAAAGATTSAAIDRLSNDHNMDRSVNSPTSGATGSSATGTSVGLDRNAGTANTPGHAGLAGVAGAGAAAGAAGSDLSDRTVGRSGTSGAIDVTDPSRRTEGLAVTSGATDSTRSSVHDELAKLPGHRRTASGAYTNADPNPSYGKTAGGHLTGADGKHGPQDSTQQSSEMARPQGPRSDDGDQTKSSNQRDFGDEKDVQHASKIGEDPSLETKQGGKLTGTGTDGSHSAVFGLTPDGHKYDDTHSGTTKLSRSGDDTGVGPSPEDDEKKGTTGVADQINKPDVANPEHSGKSEYNPDASEASGEKPGSGGITTGMEGDTGRTSGNNIGN